MEDSAPQSTDGRMDKLRREGWLRSKGIDLKEPLQLDLLFSELLHENERSLPNDFARGSLFTVRNKRHKTRPYLERVKLFHLHDGQGISLVYTGAELRSEDDELIWLQIMHYAKRVPLGQEIYFSIKELVNDVGWARNGTYYDKARLSLSRLKATELIIHNEKAFGRSPAMSLIDGYESINDEVGKALNYKVKIDPNLILLFAGKTFSNHSWEIYRDLSPVARRLADYAQSHKTPWALKLDKFKEMCGSDCKNDSSWRRAVRQACTEIVSKGLVCTAILDPKNEAINIVRD